MPAIAHRPVHPDASPGRIVTPEPGKLPLAGVVLHAEAVGGVARVVCEQRFVNRSSDPLHVTYSLPLPADAAVSGFAFRIGERRIVGEIDRRASARERFERAIAEGHTAALLDEERSSVFTQELGNVPAGAEVVAEVTIDQPLIWTDSGEWEWRFPTTVLPRYLGASGRVDDARKISQDVADGALPVRVRLELAVGDALLDGKKPAAPAHALTCRADGRTTQVEFTAEDGVPLDRDVVVRWPVAQAEAGARLVRSGAQGDARSVFGLLTIVPPECAPTTVPRDLCVLLDTSGSMSGKPLEQARRVIVQLIERLTDADTLELIEFSSRVRPWKKKAVHATAEARAEACAWLGALTAGGGTEMADAVVDALSPLRPDAQRQVVLVTDGAIGFEREVMTAILERLPANCRLHTVGIGSAVNRSLTTPAARAGRGVEIVIGLEDDPERGAERLLRRTTAPVVVELEIDGQGVVRHAPERLTDLFAGAPVLVGLELSTGARELAVRGRLANGSCWEQRVTIADAPIGMAGAAARSFFGREAVEDLEMRLAGGADVKATDAQIEALGLEFQISTRHTSWVAVTEDVTVDPSAPSRRVRMPHALPSGTSIEGLGLRGPMRMRSMAAAPMSAAAPPMARRMRVGAALDAPRAILERVTDWLSAGPSGPSEPARSGDLGYDSEDMTSEIGAMEVHEASPIDELRGVVQLRKPRSLVIAVGVESTHGVEWMPGARVEVVFDSGKIVAGTVAADRSTHAGHVVIGQTVRVWLEFAEDLPEGEPREVWLVDGERRVCIRIIA